MQKPEFIQYQGWLKSSNKHSYVAHYKIKGEEILFCYFKYGFLNLEKHEFFAFPVEKLEKENTCSYCSRIKKIYEESGMTPEQQYIESRNKKEPKKKFGPRNESYLIQSKKFEINQPPHYTHFLTCGKCKKQCMFLSNDKVPDPNRNRIHVGCSVA